MEELSKKFEECLVNNSNRLGIEIIDNNIKVLEKLYYHLKDNYNIDY